MNLKLQDGKDCYGSRGMNAPEVDVEQSTGNGADPWNRPTMPGETLNQKTGRKETSAKEAVVRCLVPSSPFIGGSCIVHNARSAWEIHAEVNEALILGTPRVRVSGTRRQARSMCSQYRGFGRGQSPHRHQATYLGKAHSFHSLRGTERGDLLIVRSRAYLAR